MKEKLTVQEVADRVGIEGIAYAVQSYYARDLESEDELLNKLWKRAYDALNRLQDYLPDSDY